MSGEFVSIVTVRLGLVLALALTVCGCGELFPQRTAGEKIYRKQCSDCHGIDGAGETLRSMGHDKTDLLDESWRYAMGESGIETVLSQDLVFEHPTFSEKLTPQEIREVGRYVRTLRSKS